MLNIFINAINYEHNKTLFLIKYFTYYNIKTYYRQVLNTFLFINYSIYLCAFQNKWSNIIIWQWCVRNVVMFLANNHIIIFTIEIYYCSSQKKMVFFPQLFVFFYLFSVKIILTINLAMTILISTLLIIGALKVNI